MRTREELPGRSPIAPGQARLTLEFFRDGLPEKKLQLVGMSILLILLSLGSGCYNHHHDKQNKSEQAAGDWRKEEKHHKHMEQLAQLGAAAAGAYAVHEKHKAKKDPEHARSHRIKEEIAATIAAGSAGFAVHEHHKRKEAKKHGHHHHH